MRRLLDGVAVCVSLLDSVSTVAFCRGAPDSLIDMRTGGNDNAAESGPRRSSRRRPGAPGPRRRRESAGLVAAHRGRLATGGGTADRSIKLWDAARGLGLSSVDTGSQVCALAWSSAEDALVSAHGYSSPDPIWRLQLARDGVLAGHGSRPLPRAVARQPVVRARATSRSVLGLLRAAEEARGC